MGTQMTRIKRIFADQIRVHPLDPRHPRSHSCRFNTASSTILVQNKI
jgi:hypothetical protein